VDAAPTTLAHSPALGRPRLGDLLLGAGSLTEEQLERALAEQSVSGRRLGQEVVALGYADSPTVARCLAEQYSLDYVELDDVNVDPAAVRLLPERLARRYLALPIALVEDDLVLVAIADPTDVVASDDLRLALGLNVRVAVADEGAIVRRIAGMYRLEVGVEDESEEAEDISAAASAGASAVGLVNDLLVSAIEAGASDLHFEPQASGLVVRARIDGIMRRLATLPRSDQTGVVIRLKVMGDLDIAERRLPQDGRVAVRIGHRKTDLRMAILPTPYGEKIVLRVHHGGGARLELSELGMSEDVIRTFTRAIRQPFGAVFVVGPTGSGKTTTLYAALDLLNDESRVLSSIEDPIEHQIPGVGQVEVNTRAGLTFARGLRTMLRADPDVLLVGEIRDEETAKIAAQASLTGHLVLTTLHAPSAAASIVRMRDMGVEPSVLAATVNCIVAQRLARRLCPSCRVPEPATADERAELGLAEGAEISRPAGCRRCDGTGFSGRVALCEIMPMEGAVLRALESSTEEIFAASVADGMGTLREDGFRLVRAGVTTLDEVRRVTGDRLF
jgi:type IV pilus assembly protein PilB